MTLSYLEMENALMEQLRLYHHPVAITWLFNDAEVEEFRRSVPHVTPHKPLTFCQWEIAARMQNKTVLGTCDKLGCSSAQTSFGWKSVDDTEIEAHLKYCVSKEQAERFLRSKPCLPLGWLKAVAVGPLGQARTMPHVVHFYCDNIQAYHLSVDYMAALNVHPLRPMSCMSSSSCGGSVFSWQEAAFNMCPACAGGYNAGKTERGEVNVFIPGEQIERVVGRLLGRVNDTGGSSLSRNGDAFPGGDICKNCPLIIFKSGEAGANMNADACADCARKPA